MSQFTSRQLNDEYRRRGLTRNRQDPSHLLQGTHTIGLASASFNTGVSFPNRSQPVTFSVHVKRTGMAPKGIVFEFGDATTGLALWLDGSSVNLAAGSGTGDDGVSVSADNQLLAAEQVAKLVIAILPNEGRISIWNRGAVIATGQTASGLMPNGWSSAAAGGIAQPSGPVTPRVPIENQIALSDAQIVMAVRGFANQIPRQFSRSPST